MKNTLTRLLALAMALMLILSACAYAAEVEVGEAPESGNAQIAAAEDAAEAEDTIAAEDAAEDTAAPADEPSDGESPAGDEGAVDEIAADEGGDAAASSDAGAPRADVPDEIVETAPVQTYNGEADVYLGDEPTYEMQVADELVGEVKTYNSGSFGSMYLGGMVIDFSQKEMVIDKTYQPSGGQQNPIQDGSVVVDVDYKTITLNGVKINTEGNGISNVSFGETYYAEAGPLYETGQDDTGYTINLVGNNIINANGQGISETGNITITGSGSLTINSSDTAIFVNSLTMESGTVEANTTGVCGIDCLGLNIEGGKLTANAGKAEDGDSKGIYCEGSIIVKKGELIANADDASGGSYGIQFGDNSNNSVHVEGGKLTANAKDAIYESIGIQCVTDNPGNGGNLLVEAGELIAKAGNTNPEFFGYSAGIDCNRLVIDNGGKVTADSGEAKAQSNGISAANGLIVNKGELTAIAKGGEIAAGMFFYWSSEEDKPELTVATDLEIRCGDKAPGDLITAEDYLALFYREPSEDDPIGGGGANEMMAADAETTLPKYFHVAAPKSDPEPEPDPTPAPTPAVTSAPAPAPAEPGALIVATMKTCGKRALKLSWTRVAGAEGYDIFLSKCGSPKFDLAATAAGSANGYTIKKLNKYTAYKGYVQAWKTVNGQKVYISDASPVMHTITGGNTNKYTNPKKITLKKSKFILKAGKTAKIKASVKKLSKKRSLLDHASKLRYYTSDPAVATVSANGAVTAVGAGSCKIYVVAISGLRKTVKVTVK